MPVARGVSRRPVIGKGATRTASISFVAADLAWAEDLATARNVTMSRIIGEALTLYRAELEAELSRIEVAEKAAKRAKIPGAPVEETVEL